MTFDLNIFMLFQRVQITSPRYGPHYTITFLHTIKLKFFFFPFHNTIMHCILLFCHVNVVHF